PNITFGCQLTSPAGCYGPDQIRAAYGITASISNGLNGACKPIAIIDAYGSPTIGNDLSVFDSAFGVPAPPSFQIVPMPGLPAVDQNDPNPVRWAGETTRSAE